jgi:hypothetical protein
LFRNFEIMHMHNSPICVLCCKNLRIKHYLQKLMQKWQNSGAYALQDKFLGISSSSAYGLQFCYFSMNFCRLSLNLNFCNKGHILMQYGFALFQKCSNHASMLFEKVCMFTPIFRFAQYLCHKIIIIILKIKSDSYVCLFLKKIPKVSSRLS